MSALASFRQMTAYGNHDHALPFAQIVFAALGAETPPDVRHFLETVTDKPNGAVAGDAVTLNLYLAANSLLRAAKGLDAYWTEAHPSGPDGDRTCLSGFGVLADDTLEVWRAIRSAITEAQPGQT